LRLLHGTKELEFYAIARRGYKAMLGLAVGQFEILTPIVTIKKIQIDPLPWFQKRSK
jgi:hypothetical protein